MTVRPIRQEDVLLGDESFAEARGVRAGEGSIAAAIVVLLPGPSKAFASLPA